MPCLFGGSVRVVLENKCTRMPEEANLFGYFLRQNYEFESPASNPRVFMILDMGG
jgi:hypothetical protein